jgi:hypothetical protein
VTGIKETVRQSDQASGLLAACHGNGTAEFARSSFPFCENSLVVNSGKDCKKTQSSGKIAQFRMGQGW